MTYNHDTVSEGEKTVKCDGSFSYPPKQGRTHEHGHPVIYLKINKNNHADCPYCGRKFSYQEASKDPG